MKNLLYNVGMLVIITVWSHKFNTLFYIKVWPLRYGRVYTLSTALSPSSAVSGSKSWCLGGGNPGGFMGGLRTLSISLRKKVRALPSTPPVLPQ